MNRTRYALGLGCRRGADPQHMIDLVQTVMTEAGLSATDLSAVATIDGKEAERAVNSAAAILGQAITVFSAARLEEETPRLANPSDIVFRETGCHGVAEAAALAALGVEGRLLVAKRVLNGCTAAVAAVALP